MAKRTKKTVRRRPASGTEHISKDDEYALIARAQSGDERAMTALLRKHRGFVYMTASRYRGRGLEMEDLVQAGTLGLATAIRRFDPAYGARLTTYSNWWIRAKINFEIVEGGKLIHIPQRVMEEMAAIDREIQRSLAKTGNQPTDKALLQKLGLNRKHLAVARDATILRSPASLDVATNDEEPWRGAFVDLLTAEGTHAEEMMIAGEMRERLSEILTNVLNPVELAIIRCRFVDDLTLEETAERVAPLMRLKRVVTRERIRQIEERLLNKLRYHLTGKGFA